MHFNIKHTALVTPAIGLIDHGFDDLLGTLLALLFFKCFPRVLRKTGLNRDEREVATDKATLEAIWTFMRLCIHVRHSSPHPPILVCLPETICL